jgi:uncharacterized protein YndB with AHSA1/START domain
VHAVSFVESGGKTTVTVRSRVTKTTAEANRYIGGFEAGMTQSLVRLGEFLDRGGAEALSSTASTREIVISRVFDAPRELVWEVWTDPKQVVKWWGPRGFTTTIKEMNVKPGGVWKHVMRGPDGTEYPNESIFTEVVKPERIVYTHGGRKKDGPEAQFVATWSFDVVEEGKTRLTIRQVYPSTEMRDTIVRVYGAVEGGKQTLARLAEHLVTGPVVVERVFAAPVELVWRALTNVEDIKNWSFPLKEFKAEVGFEFQFVAGKEGRTQFNHLCQVTEAVPNQKLAYSWRYEGYPGDSLVTIELAPEGEKTRLKLTHTGLESFQPEKHPDLARGNFFQGWTMIIGTLLKEFVEGLRRP